MKNRLNKAVGIIIATLMLCTLTEASAQFQQNNARSLFSDVKAYRQGDAITILITEMLDANNSANELEERSTGIGGSASAGAKGTGFGGSADLGTKNNFTGRGATTRSESIKSKLSARITEVDNNGNLSIEGKRTTKINGETQTITIKGSVRPVDILPNNAVYSYNILDLSLIIEGEGNVTKMQEPGLITKFLRILF